MLKLSLALHRESEWAVGSDPVLQEIFVMGEKTNLIRGNYMKYRFSEIIAKIFILS